MDINFANLQSGKSKEAGLKDVGQADQAMKFVVKDVRVHYDDFEALHGINMSIPDNGVTAFIGPSGCGKSSFLRVFNRMNDTIEGCRVSGDIRMDGEDIYAKGLDPVLLRARVGMVFQKPNPWSMG